MSRRRRLLLGAALAAALALLALACSDAGGGDGDGGDATVDLDDAGEADFEATGGVMSIIVSGAEPGTELYAVDRDGDKVEAFFPPNAQRKDGNEVDEKGNLAFGRVPPGTYRVAGDPGGGLVASEPLEVLAVDDHPDQSFYDGQVLEEGYQYLEMRDGTTLAAMVRFPDDPLPGTPEGGPYPTVVEYSGYDPSNPTNPQPATLFMDTYGYATVGVNLRGTTCSGGVLSYFEPDQVADGYDVIETVAAQDWVLDNEVGMVGLSYPGISQTYVAMTQPPSLAAVTPLSIVGDIYKGTVFPGGIYNSGFVQEWSAQVGERAEPAGDGFVRDLIGQGDDECAANQALRSQNLDLVESARSNPYDAPDVYGVIDPSELVDRIDVPAFVTGTWQDEQVGGYAALLEQAMAGNDRAWFTFTNGAHGDGFTPELVQPMLEFLDLYVAKRIPEIPSQARLLVPGALEPVFGGPLEFGPDRLADAASYEEALAEFEARDRFTVLFESGAGNPEAPGTVDPTFEEGFDSFPTDRAEAATLWLDPQGTMTPTEPVGGTEGAVTYGQDPGQADDLTLEGGQDVHFDALPSYEWVEPPEGFGASWVSRPFHEDTVLVGPSRVDLWVSSTAEDTDLEVTLSEVRPDGSEFYIQSGWQRASLRALDDEAGTAIRPVPTFAEADAEPLVPGVPTEIAVEVFPVAHVLREGSRLRLSVDSPGGNRVRWQFETIEVAGETNTIGTSSAFPSRLTVPLLTGLDVPDRRPPCPSLRAQPCRQFDAPENELGSLVPGPQ